MIFFNELIYLLSDFFLIIFLFFLLLLSVYFSKFIKSLIISQLIIDLGIPLVFIVMLLNLNLINLNLIIFLNLKIDNFFIFFKFILLLMFFFCILSSRSYFLIENMYIYEYPIILFLSIEGSFFVMMSYDLFIIYLALELQNFCFYIISSIKRYSSFSTEAGLKYFLLGSFSSSLFLYGISIFYGLFGTLNLFDIKFFLENNLFFHDNKLFLISLFFIIFGMIFKIGGVPFHWWLPDVYEGSPTIVTMFFSILPKLVYFYLFLKLYICIFSYYYFFFNYVLFIVGILSIVLGILNAMYQYRIKRFLAYSSIANIGYILLSLSLCSFVGIFSSLYFVLCYLISVLIIFLFLNNFRNYKYYEFSYIAELSLISNNIVLSFFLSLAFFSFAAIPPLAGFFGKFLIFFALINEYNYYLLLLLLFLSIFSGFYYIRIVRFIFFNKIYEYSIITNYGLIDLLIIISIFNLFFMFFFDFFGENLFFLLIKFLYLL